MEGLGKEATQLREQATDVFETMEIIDSYLNRLKDLCIEVNYPELVFSAILFTTGFFANLFGELIHSNFTHNPSTGEKKFGPKYGS